MNENYLDISKSVMISSPAGSGKTEKLARRYISLLKGGTDVERILAITFTDKAAAEMKERILNILKAEDHDLFEKIKEKVPRMRISTIHSFCLKLLKRFAIDLGIDPSLEVLDGFTQGILWSEAVYESLLEESRTGKGAFSEILKREGIKGWNKLYSIFEEIHKKRPDIELGLRNDIIIYGEPERFPHLEDIISLYSSCLERYRKKKLKRHLLDYNDLELMAYEAITKNPEWQNILFSFDEHTDHILIDEFQDTSSLQWRIIDKLTEEWRSGLGAKIDQGIKPTIFLVGDDKQSIYSFRGANVDIFKQARKILSEWLNDEYHFIEIEENYRSLPTIVNFVNSLFERIMTPDLMDKPGAVKYSPFKPEREGSGEVRLCVIESTGNIRVDRKREALYIANRIIEIVNKLEVYDGKMKRNARHADMAILLRSRTHLSIFEDALRQYEIPFVVVKGIGFYQSPEVSILRDILFFLIDQKDDYSFFNILRSPFFSIGYKTILDIAAKSPSTEAGFLFPLLQESSREENIRRALSHITNWLAMSKDLPYAVLLEKILNETEGWKYFSEPQRYRNVKKFLRIIEGLEFSGMAEIEIRENLIRASSNPDEPKANINSERIDAVRIMTIHAAKGLQFPIVFLPCLDEEGSRSGRFVMEESGDRLIIAYEDDSAQRKENPLFLREKDRSLEEDKRVFYVAVTRAMDHLYMSGIMKDKPKGRLAQIATAFNIDLSEGSKQEGLPFSIGFLGGEQEIPPVPYNASRSPFKSLGKLQQDAPVIYTDPIDFRPAHVWRDVTEEIEYIRKRHGDNWVVLGRVFHNLFEAISKGFVRIDNIDEKIDNLIRQETASSEIMRNMREIIRNDLNKMKESGLLDEIVLPRDNSFAELPFILHKGNTIYKGRIDRIIIDGDVARIYDYKTYPVTEGELPELKDKYSFQLQLYREAVERIFSIKAEAYLFFTHELRIERI